MSKIKRLYRENYFLIEKFLEDNFSSPTHWPDWNELIAKYYGSQFYYLGYFEGSVLTGICPFHQEKHKSFLKIRFSGQYHMIPNGGWIFSRPVTLTDAFFKGKWNIASQVFSMPLLPEFNAIFSAEKAVKQTLIADLRDTEEDIWKNQINSKRRNMIRKAAKQGIIIERVKDLAGIRGFYELYHESAGQYSNQPLPIDFFIDLFHHSENINFDIFIAKQGEQQLANVGIISDKNYSFYWLGNNLKDTQNLGQGDALQWHVIKEMKNRGCRYYDLCYIEPESLPAIYSFKKGFSNEEYKIDVLNIRPLAYRILNKFV